MCYAEYLRVPPCFPYEYSENAEIREGAKSAGNPPLKSIPKGKLQSITFSRVIYCFIVPVPVAKTNR